MCDSGNTASWVSAGVRPMGLRMDMTEVMLKWVVWTPLALPDVPEE